MALSCKVPAALPLHVFPSFFIPSFLLGYLLFLLYLAPYHWSWEASLSALWNCVFSVFICHVCTLIPVKKHLPGHAKQGTKQGRWMGRTLRPASQIIIPPEVNLWLKSKVNLLEQTLGRPKSWLKVTCSLFLGGVRSSCLLGLLSDSHIKVLVRMERLGSHNKLGILPAPLSLLSPTCMSC